MKRELSITIQNFLLNGLFKISSISKKDMSLTVNNE